MPPTQDRDPHPPTGPFPHWKQDPELEPVEDLPFLSMQEWAGVWCLPIKLLDGFGFALEWTGTRWELDDAQEFVNGFASAEMVFAREGLTVVRTDFVAEDEPAHFSTLRLATDEPHGLDVKLCFQVRVNLSPRWFTCWADGRDVVLQVGSRIAAYDSLHRDAWGVVGGADLAAESFRVDEQEHRLAAELAYPLRLEAGATREVTFLIVGEH